MEDPLTVEAPVYPIDLNTFSIPNDAILKRVHHVYKPSNETIQLLSEKGRSVYPEVFSDVGTLVDLCVSEIARKFGAKPIPLVASNPLLLQVHYDAIDVDLPLDDCYGITEERFWKRVVLTKHSDKTLAIQPNIDWKNLGVTLKYVEFVENCMPEFWTEEEMKELALKVKEFVREMHIKRLRSLKDRSFDKYFQSDTESSEEESESSVSTSTEEEEEEAEEKEKANTGAVPTEGEEKTENTEITEKAEKTESQLKLEKEMAKQKAIRKKERQELREAKQKAREAKEKVREAKRKRREAKQAKLAAAEELPNKRPKRIPNNVFAIQVSESEDEEEFIVDKRNKELYLRNFKKYDYPPKDCHHVDLKFVQYLTNLEKLVIEFLGPIQSRSFHQRNLNFSYDDIKHLETGLRNLPKLKVFRLRNSRMDAEKLKILCRGLATIKSLETLDFGHDQLKDDCGSVFEELFELTESLQSLELESNFLGEQVLRKLGDALSNYESNELLYLGLARNPITDVALHALVSNIIGTKHIHELNIRGAPFITDRGLICCISSELIRQHPTLVKLDICAIKISPRAANEIMKSLTKNKKILQFYCCGCDLDAETEIDVNVLMRRNKFVSENYFLGDLSKTNEEVNKWLNRTKNPILLKVLDEVELHKQCLQERSKYEEQFTYLSSRAPSHISVDVKRHMYENNLSDSSSSEMEISAEIPQRFVYPSDDFDEQEFLEHVYQPGPQDRYYYFKMCKEKYSVRDDVKNKSII